MVACFDVWLHHATSILVAEICKVLGIKKTRTTPYHPQGDGMVERFNRTLISLLSTAIKDHHTKWEDHLRATCMAYNTSEQSTTGFTPFFLMFGREARMPIDIMFGRPPEHEGLSHPEYAIQLRDKFESSYDAVWQHRQRAFQRQKDLTIKHFMDIHTQKVLKKHFMEIHTEKVL